MVRILTTLGLAFCFYLMVFALSPKGSFILSSGSLSLLLLSLHMKDPYHKGFFNYISFTDIIIIFSEPISILRDGPSYSENYVI